MDRSDNIANTGDDQQTVRTVPSSTRSVARATLSSQEAVSPPALNGSAALSSNDFVFDVGKMAVAANGATATNGYGARDNGSWSAIGTGAEPTPQRQRPPQSSAANFARTFLRTAGYLFGGWLAIILALIIVFRFVDPPFSALMASHWLRGNPVHEAFVPLDAISPNVVRAVLLSEDGRFCEHWGVDISAIEKAIARARGGTPRGASTISMQVTKNLFLWPAKSYVRKFIEIPLTYTMELIWPKRRVMEVYLNIAEWGPGIFGVEAASRFHFNKPAARLTEREAAQLAVALPNPIQRAAGDPGPRTQRMAGDIQARMRAAPRSASRCVLGRF